MADPICFPDEVGNYDAKTERVLRSDVKGWPEYPCDGSR
jgi:hypothetical protein